MSAWFLPRAAHDAFSVFFFGMGCKQRLTIALQIRAFSHCSKVNNSRACSSRGTESCLDLNQNSRRTTNHHRDASPANAPAIDQRLT